MQNMPNFAELPDSVRNIMKSSIEQARKAFETFVASSEKMMQSLDTSSIPAADGVKQLNERIAAFTRQNAESNFNLALQLTDAKHLSEIVELQNAHLRQQMEIFSHQMEELRELTMKAVKDGTKAASSAVQNAASSLPSNPFMGSN
jgi:phasin